MKTTISFNNESYPIPFLVMILICVLFVSTHAQGANWKYFGASLIKNGNETDLCFYDSNSIKYSHSGIVRVWTKTLNKSKIKDILDASPKSKNSLLVQKIGKAIISGYIPPIISIVHKHGLDLMTVIGCEVVADKAEIQPSAQILWELSCRNKTIRCLSISMFDNNGRIIGASRNGPWDYIAPETNADALQKILCQNRH